MQDKIIDTPSPNNYNLKVLGQIQFVMKLLLDALTQQLQKSEEELP